MEDERLRKDMLTMIDVLSTFIMNNGIELTEMRDEFTNSIAQYVQINTLKGLKKVIEVFHKLLCHQGSSIRLDCKSLHCIECYSYFVGADFYNDSTVCTCGTRINPKLRNTIQNEYNRLQALKRQCSYCTLSKDIMNFNQIEHGCSLCIDCLKSNFKFFSNDNYCPRCLYVFSEESLSAIRSLLSDQQDPMRLIQFYTKECFVCNQNKDSRLFTQICTKKHLACEECINQMKIKFKSSCECGQEISIF